MPASKGSCNLSFKEFSVSQEATFEDNRETSNNDRGEEELTHSSFRSYGS